MGYTLGQAAKAVGMSKTSILRSIKSGRISAGRDEFGQWAIEPCELHRVYPALTEDTVTGNGPGKRAVTGAKRLLPKPLHAPPWPKHGYPIRLDGVKDGKERLQSAVGQIAPVRNEIAHVREVNRDRLLRASVACTDVLEMLKGGT